MKNTLTKIETLFKSGKKLEVIECGCAATLANKLMSLPGASSFIDKCLQLYSKESQESYLGKKNKRSVSKEFIEDLLDKDESNKICLSFQLTDGKSHTHGWVGTKIDKIKRLYHLSLDTNIISDEDMSSFDLEDKFEYRSSILEKINESCINILYNNIIDNKSPIKDSYIDFTSDQNQTIFDILSNNTKDSFVVFDKGQWMRMEDICRSSKGFILMRGSFNPIHHGHLSLLNESLKEYPDYTPIFLISVNNFDKKSLTKEECIERAKQINDMGYIVVFCTTALFSVTLQNIRNRWKLPIVMPVGMDTINRFIDYENKNEIALFRAMSKNSDMSNSDILALEPSIFIFYEEAWLNSKFLVFKRKGYELTNDWERYNSIIEFNENYIDDGISSSEIRKNKK